MKTTELGHAQNFVSFEHFLKHSPLIAWINDAQGNLRYINETYCRIFNLTQNDVGKSIFDLFPLEIAEAFHNNNLKVIQSGEPMDTLETAVLPGKKERYYKVSKFPIEWYGEVVAAGWGLDITQNLTNSSLLVESHERYTLVQNAVSDAIYDWEADSNYAILEMGFRDMFGYAYETITIRRYLKLIHPKDVSKVIDAYRNVVRNAKSTKWAIEYRVKCANGSYKHVLDKGIVSRMSGLVYRAIGALRDVTENYVLQRTMLAKEKAAKRKIVRSIIETQENERMNLSKELHDNVNQMLASCKLMLEVALDGGPTSTHFVNKAYTSIQEIITEIRSISHQLNTSAVQDVGVVEAVDILVKQLNSIQPIRFSFYHNLDARFVKSWRKEDRIAIYRIIQEQTNNIIKHSRARNSIIAISNTRESVNILTADDGVGFDTKTARYGIGFRNIQNRVDYYKGQLQVSSEPGKGTKVEVILNLAETL